jgi:uncharacterized protein (TIGR02996 family)
VTQALLDDIHARPDDDRPRLVYADWLLEQGDPRGELIQLQIAGHAAEADALLRRHRAAWEPRLRTPGRFAWSFARGFPARVEANGADLTAAAEELIAKVPTLREAVITRFDLLPEELLRSPVLPRLEGLTLHYLPQTPTPAREELLRELLDDPRMLGLRRFGISYSYLGLAEWLAIAGSRLMPVLEGLFMGLANARNDVIAPIVHAGRKLRAFSIANGQVGTAGVQAIAQAPNVLEWLDLSWNRVGVRGAKALADSPYLSGLRTLDLSHCQIGDEGCEAIAQGRLSGLKELRLEQSRITARGALALAALPGLERIDAKNNGLDDATMRALQRGAGSRAR